MVQCVVCGKEIEPGEADYTLKVGGKTYYYCGLECLYESEPLEKVRDKNISALVLNKSFFEVMALITRAGRRLLHPHRVRYQRADHGHVQRCIGFGGYHDRH